MSIWNKISGFIHGAGVKVADVFVHLFGADAAHKFADSAMGLLRSAQGKIVLDAVEAAQSLSTDGAGKRAAAFEKIAADFKSQGLVVGDSVINMLVELAVGYLKGLIAAK